jgi:Xaa-Pro dipeptidase
LEQLDVPKISLAERDRRWATLRDRMREAGLECLVLPYNTGHWGQFQADVQYVTSMGGNDSEITAVFPLDGEVTAWARSAGYLSAWRGVQNWVTDLRNSRGIWGPGVVERLRELKLTSGHIGIVGLNGLTRAAEGIVPYEMMRHLETELPHAKFSSATKLVQDVRSVKSDEEIGLLSRAAHIAELAGAAMARAALPGVTDAHVYGAAYSEMLMNGGEVPTLFLFRAGADVHHNFYFPTNRPLQAGDIISSELEAKYCGYRAQIVQPVAVSYLKEPYKSMIDIAVRSFDELTKALVPGVSVGRLADLCDQLTNDSLPYTVRLIIGGRGLGEDGPLVVGSASPEARSATLPENSVFILKPVISTDEPARSIGWGDTVVVKPGGALRLGRRDPGASVSHAH